MFSMVHMPSLPNTPENLNSSDAKYVNAPYCDSKGTRHPPYVEIYCWL